MLILSSLSISIKSEEKIFSSISLKSFLFFNTHGNFFSSLSSQLIFNQKILESLKIFLNIEMSLKNLPLFENVLLKNLISFGLLIIGFKYFEK